MANKSVVITGASTGIGWGTTEVLIQKGFNVFGTVRKQADADRLQAEFGPAFTPLLMDVTDQPAVQRAADQVRQALGNANLAGLVNNAGISVVGPLLRKTSKTGPSPCSCPYASSTASSASKPACYPTP